ncbi:MAG TPA: hypothetical protein VK509_24370 [Polyangiales bacterium]|nr:hypothetical protein [Polyangiales bacterium]
MTGKQSGKPISERLKDSIRDLADRIVEAIGSALQPSPQPVPIPVRSRYRYR